MGIATDIQEQGWSYEPYGLDEEAMAEYALAARLVIEAALQDDQVASALKHEDHPDSTGLSPHRTPGLDKDKEVLQLIPESENYAETKISIHNQPLELRRFWPLHREVLRAVVACGRDALEDMDTPFLTKTMFGDNVTDRNIFLRTNWFRGATDYANKKPQEILSGHADKGALTLHLYETHKGFLQGAPYRRDVAFNGDTQSRDAQLAEMTEALRDVEPRDGEAVVFLGAGWWNIRAGYIPAELRDLPALYHVATQPVSPREPSPYSDMVTGGKPDRVSVVAFIDPTKSMSYAGHYEPADREIARPTMKFTDPTLF